MANIRHYFDLIGKLGLMLLLMEYLIDYLKVIWETALQQTVVVNVEICQKDCRTVISKRNGFMVAKMERLLKMLSRRYWMITLAKVK